MNNKKLYAISAAAIFIAALSLPASAAMLDSRLEVSAKASSTRPTKLDVNARTNAAAQIDGRVKALTALKNRIGQMKKISAEQKTSLQATVQASIDEMLALKAKITAETDGAALKVELQSIAKAYRIYLLIIPKIQIMAAADKILAAVDMFNELSVKLQARITAAQTAGADVAALNRSLADMKAKIADAKVQAEAAINLVVNLKPDNGDRSVFESNKTALKDARAKIRAGHQDLKDARKHAGSIVKALASMKLSTSTNASSTMSR